MKKKKTKTVYYEDKGETVYSMAPLEGKTPEQKAEEEKNRKNFPTLTRKERHAMIAAAFTVYGPLLLMLVGAFAVVALFLYFYIR